jgi:rubrerythrin
MSWREKRRAAKAERKAERHGRRLAAPSVTTVVEKEVVKVPCKYCGDLVEITGEATKCPNCGAPIIVGS